MFKLSLNKISPKMLLIVAVILSLITAVLIYIYLKQEHYRAVAAQDVVVVAVKDIPVHTLITEDMIKQVQIPSDLVQAGAKRDVKSIIGTMTAKPIVAGEQITEVKLAVTGQETSLSWNIPPHKRAFTIAIHVKNAVQGFIKVGDFIDIIGIFDKDVIGETAGHVLVQNVQVLAINNIDGVDNGNVKDKIAALGGEKVISVTLAVSLNDALLLGLACEKGKIHVALRPFGVFDYDVIDSSVGISQLVGHFVAKDVVTSPAALPPTQLPTTSIQSAAQPPVQKPVEQVPQTITPNSGAANTTGITVIHGTKIEVAN